MNCASKYCNSTVCVYNIIASVTTALLLPITFRVVVFVVWMALYISIWVKREETEEQKKITETKSMSFASISAWLSTKV